MLSSRLLVISFHNTSNICSPEQESHLGTLFKPHSTAFPTFTAPSRVPTLLRASPAPSLRFEVLSISLQNLCKLSSSSDKITSCSLPSLPTSAFQGLPSPLQIYCTVPGSSLACSFLPAPAPVPSCPGAPCILHQSLVCCLSGPSLPDCRSPHRGGGGETTPARAGARGRPAPPRPPLLTAGAGGGAAPSAEPGAPPHPRRHEYSCIPSP